MSEKLEEIRKKIDALDDRIHDLLMERADLIVNVSEAKKKTNTPVVQPAREAKMIRRLLKRHRGPLPEAAVLRIWRELVGAVSLLQTGLKVTVSMADGQGFCWDLAKNYFGSVLPMVRASGVMVAVASVREDDANFAVLPWPSDGERSPWWPFLINQDNQKGRMRIVCALPYGVPEEQKNSIQDRALVLSKTDFAASGEDHSFLALEIDPSVSRARILDVFKSLDLELLTLNTRSGSETGGQSQHFIEVNDYIAEQDPRIEKLIQKFEGQNARCVALGGYPVTPILKTVVTGKTSERKTGT